MPLVIENDIERRLKKRVEEVGGKCIKFNAVSEGGIPDRIVVLKGGRIIFVELKRPRGGKVSPLQTYQIEKLRGLGCRVELVKNYDDIERLIEDPLGKKLVRNISTERKG